MTELKKLYIERLEREGMIRGVDNIDLILDDYSQVSDEERDKQALEQADQFTYNVISGANIKQLISYAEDYGYGQVDEFPNYKELLLDRVDDYIPYSPYTEQITKAIAQMKFYPDYDKFVKKFSNKLQLDLKEAIDTTGNLQYQKQQEWKKAQIALMDIQKSALRDFIWNGYNNFIFTKIRENPYEYYVTDGGMTNEQYEDADFWVTDFKRYVNSQRWTIVELIDLIWWDRDYQDVGYWVIRPTLNPLIPEKTFYIVWMETL